MSFDLMNNNKAVISGVIEKDLEYSHEVYGEKFYDTTVRVNRLSGYFDSVPVTISEKLVDEHGLKMGKVLSGYGQFRSYNKIDGGKSKLVLTMFIRELDENGIEKDTNHVEFNGYICKTPIYRTTPFKREICDVLVAVNRSYNKSDYLPCIAWGRNAKYIKDFTVGEKVRLVGRIQSRAYQKKFDNGVVEDRVAYEISLNKISKQETQENTQKLKLVTSEDMEMMHEQNNY